MHCYAQKVIRNFDKLTKGDKIIIEELAGNLGS
jgi:hypothetical protein